MADKTEERKYTLEDAGTIAALIELAKIQTARICLLEEELNKVKEGLVKAKYPTEVEWIYFLKDNGE